MTDKKVNSQVNNRVMNPVVAAVAGAVIGGAAVASAMVMSNKGNQKKVKAAVSGFADDVQDKKTALVGKANKLGGIAKNTVNDVKNI